VTFRPAEHRGFRIERDGDGPFRVVGAGIDRLVRATIWTTTRRSATSRRGCARSA